MEWMLNLWTVLPRGSDENEGPRDRALRHTWGYGKGGGGVLEILKMDKPSVACEKKKTEPVNKGVGDTYRR